MSRDNSASVVTRHDQGCDKPAHPTQGSRLGRWMSGVMLNHPPDSADQDPPCREAARDDSAPSRIGDLGQFRPARNVPGSEHQQAETVGSEGAGCRQPNAPTGAPRAPARECPAPATTFQGVTPLSPIPPSAPNHQAGSIHQHDSNLRPRPTDHTRCVDGGRCLAVVCGSSPSVVWRCVGHARRVAEESRSSRG